MGVATALAGITFSQADVSQAQTLGIDVTGQINNMQNAIGSISAAMNKLVTEVLTPAGDAANITIINAQITALS